MPEHPFIVGERYEDRRGEFTVTAIDGTRILFSYDDGTQHVGDLETKARIYKNVLAERKSAHPILTAPYFRTLGFLAGRSEFQAEVPPQAQGAFEHRYFLVAGERATLGRNGYFPIQIETTWDKWGPELRIYFPETRVQLEFPPGVEIRPGSKPGSLRINNNRLWWMLVRVGFRLGATHNIAAIRATTPTQFLHEFDGRFPSRASST